MNRYNVLHRCVLTCVSCVLIRVSCVLTCVSCVLIRVSCVLTCVSCVLTRVSCLLTRVSCVLNGIFCVLTRVSCVLNGVSCILNGVRYTYYLYIRLYIVHHTIGNTMQLWEIQGCFKKDVHYRDSARDTQLDHMFLMVCLILLSFKTCLHFHLNLVLVFILPLQTQ